MGTQGTGGNDDFFHPDGRGKHLLRFRSATVYFFERQAYTTKKWKRPFTDNLCHTCCSQRVWDTPLVPHRKTWMAGFETSQFLPHKDWVLGPNERMPPFFFFFLFFSPLGFMTFVILFWHDPGSKLVHINLHRLTRFSGL